MGELDKGIEEFSKKAVVAKDKVDAGIDALKKSPPIQGVKDAYDYASKSPIAKKIGKGLEYFKKKGDAVNKDAQGAVDTLINEAEAKEKK
jgi:hypothetical protein